MENSGKAIKINAMRSPCPIANALELFGDKWTLLVLRDLFTGKSTFGDFQSSPEGIPTNILADRLKRLQAHGLIDRKPYQQRPLRYAYALTAKGRSLGPVLKEIINWGKKNIAGTQVRMKLEL